METKEKVKVFIRIENGKTLCICHRGAKKCNRKCEPDVVERDKFRGWEETMRRNKYGK